MEILMIVSILSVLLFFECIKELIFTYLSLICFTGINFKHLKQLLG
jgi:hypothetical protein